MWPENGCSTQFFGSQTTRKLVSKPRWTQHPTRRRFRHRSAAARYTRLHHWGAGLYTVLLPHRALAGPACLPHGPTRPSPPLHRGPALSPDNDPPQDMHKARRSAGAPGSTARPIPRSLAKTAFNTCPSAESSASRSSAFCGRAPILIISPIPSSPPPEGAPGSP